MILTVILAVGCRAAGAETDFGAGDVPGSLPDAAREAVEGWDTMDAEDLGGGVRSIVEKGFGQSEGSIKASLGLCLSIFAVTVLAAVVRSSGAEQAETAMELAGVLAISMILYGQISGFFTQMTRTVDEMAVFSGALFPAMASAAAASGRIGTSTALLGITTAVCGAMSRGLELIFLPAISCYMALMTANYAVGDESLKMLGDMLKQLITTALKFVGIGFTAYLSLTGVISGSVDSASIRAAKLTISTAVPVVGSMIADASETLLVSAGMIRGSLGILGLLGVLAVSIGPFIETGCSYLMLKCTAAATAATGEKRLSGLVSTMAGAVGLITAVTGVCTLLVMIGCVCFLRGL